MTTVLVTGADGFIGRNLSVRLAELVDCKILKITRQTSHEDLRLAAAQADIVFHLAGINRPNDPAEFATGNAGFTSELTGLLAEVASGAPVVFASSIQAERDNPYGISKKAAEDLLLRFSEATRAPVRIFRLANVFGKWARPNYNSAVATFCYNTVRGLPITIHDFDAPLGLVYVDDVIDTFLAMIDNPPRTTAVDGAGPVYETTVGAVARMIESFRESRETMIIPQVGVGLERALYATYVSYLTPEAFAYAVPVHSDPRGDFVEMLKTPSAGQFSYFTAGPGVTRGNHYHHSKVEKFLVISGLANFRFRHIESDEEYQIDVEGGAGRIVETIPGWTHNITNIGDTELVVMLWANEIFDRSRPDTTAAMV